MHVIHLKKGFSPRIAGRPATTLQHLARPRRVGMLPKHIPFIKPRLMVAENDPVAIGTPLFEDKRDPRIRFLSPGGGRIERIAFGPRRVIEEIVIRLDDDEAAVPISVPTIDALANAPRAQVVDILLTGGMWPFLRALPYLDRADPDTIPPAIHVRLGDDEPFAPQPAVYLEGRTHLFDIGLTLLGRLCERVVVHATGDPPVLPDLPAGVAVRRFTGSYPAGNPWVQRYHTKRGPAQNRSWFIDGQEVVLLGVFVSTGRYPVERIVAVGGSRAATAGHVSTRAGVPLALLTGEDTGAAGGMRAIVGGVFTGFSGSLEGFMGFYQTALNLVDDGDREEPFAFIRPGYDRPSHSTAFLSALHRKPFPMDCSQHGEERACINCGSCAAVCPVDILPQFTLKCLVADEVEEALAHGLLDCAECGLCTYVCPSKIELGETFRAAKARYYKESV